MTSASNALLTGVSDPTPALDEMRETLSTASNEPTQVKLPQRIPAQGRPPGMGTPRRDPRDEVLVPLDVLGLVLLGRFGCMTGPQLRFEGYGGCKESNFARRLARWVARGWVCLMRFLGMGCNLVWLTQRGADALVDGGFATADQLFPRTRVVAAKDLAHHLYIVDLCLLALRGIPRAYQSVEPAIAIQRRLQPQPEAIPDVLLSSPSKVTGRRNLLAFEVDLGTEAVQVFGKKLEAASRVLTEWANGGAANVVILTRGSGRASSIERELAARAVAIRVPMVVRQLPRGGSLNREALAAVISRRGTSSDGTPSGERL